jgi:hypothetical protein
VVAFAQLIVLAAAGAVPWLPLVAIVAVPTAIVARRRRHLPVMAAQPIPPPSA